jgi:Fe-S-cluster containining protein
MISPQLAIGMSEPKKYLLYQLNANTCPHIDNKNKCLVYDKRPLMCKAFPYESGNFSNKCTVLSYRKMGQTYYDFRPSRFQIDASEKLNRYLRNGFQKYFRKGINVWEYDLATEKWLFRAKHNKNPYV